MNEQQFESNLKAAFVTPEMPLHMENKIDAAVDRFQARRTNRRRFVLSMGATAAVAGGVFLFPAVKAQASLGGIIGALDRKTQAKISMFRVDENGQRWPNGVTFISNGNIKTLDSRNKVKEIDVDLFSYGFDDSLKVFVKRARPRTFGIKLSDMIGPAAAFSIKKKVDLTTLKVNGKEILRATIKNGDLLERYIIDADPKTDLPFSIRVESQELSKWRVRQECKFDFEPTDAIVAPNGNEFPILTQKEMNQKFDSFMTSKTLASFKATGKTITIRALDVAADGTVFVAYQSGEKRLNSWSGYKLCLTDNLGTNYARYGDIFSNYRGDGSEVAPLGGKIELEVFVPVKPVEPSKPRTFGISLALDAKGKVQYLFADDDMENWTRSFTVVKADGSKAKQTQRISDSNLVMKLLMTKKFEGATCATYPSWASGISYQSFGNDVYAEIFKASARAKIAKDKQEWSEALKCTNDVLHWMKESETQGYSSWDLNGTLKQIEELKQKI